MAKRLRYALSFAPEAIEHLAAIESKYHGLLRRTIREQLTQTPTGESRNRKPLRPNPIAPWELRVGDLRIFYEVAASPASVVHILAVGIKDRNIVRIGGQEFQL